MAKDYKYMVATRCMTYNQAGCIEDALRGFAMQETNFPIVFIVVDDASEDGAQEVLRTWAEKHLQKGETGLLWSNMTYGQLVFSTMIGKPLISFVILLLNENYYQSGRHSMKMDFISEWYNDAKYNALCEGDDYWIDSKKLQTQVDFLETHADYSMCFHNAIVDYEDIDKAPSIFNRISSDCEVGLEDLISKWIVPTASMCYRSGYLPLFPVKERIVSGDLRIILHLAGKGKVWALKKVMSCYRMTYCTDSSTSRNKNNNAYMCYQKHHILECFDEYTNYKYHNLVGKYSKYWYDYSVFTERKNRNFLWAVLSMPMFVLRKAFYRY